MAAASSKRGAPPPPPGSPKRQWWQRPKQQQQQQPQKQQQRRGLGQDDDDAYAAQQDLLARRRRGVSKTSGGSKGAAGLAGERGMEEPWVDPEAAFEIKAVYCMKIWRSVPGATPLLYRRREFLGGTLGAVAAAGPSCERRHAIMQCMLQNRTFCLP